MSNATKLNMILKQTIELVTVDYIVTQIREIQAEMKAGKFTQDEVLSRIFTVGSAMEIPHWETDSVVVTEMVAALIGRTVKAIKNQVDPNNQIDIFKLVPVLNSTNDVELKAIKVLTTH